MAPRGSGAHTPWLGKNRPSHVSTVSGQNNPESKAAKRCKHLMLPSFGRPLFNVVVAPLLSTMPPKTPETIPEYFDRSTRLASLPRKR